MIKNCYKCYITWPLIVFLILTSFSVSGDSWTQFGHDDLNSGLSSSKVPQNLDVLWSNSIDGEPLAIIADDSTVYVGAQEYITDVGPSPNINPTYGGVAAVYSFDLKDGKKKWMTEFEDDVRGLALSEEKLIVSSFGHLVALKRNTGEVIWDTKIGIDMFPPAINGNKVYVISSNRFVYAFNIENGKVNWSFNAYSNFLSSLVVYDGKVIFGGIDSRVYALDENNGSIVWKFQTGDQIISTPAINEGIVYIGSHDGNLYALDAKTGNLTSNFTTEGKVYTPAIGYDKVYFMCKIDGVNYKLIAIDIETFTKVWEFPFKGYMNYQPTLADGKVIIGAQKNLYILDSENGEEIKNKEFDIEISTQPIIVNEKIIIGISEVNRNEIYVLGGKSGLNVFPILLAVIILVTVILIAIWYLLKRRY